MDVYQPTAAMRAEALETRRLEAYADGRADEREQWEPLANLLQAHIGMAEQNQGAVTLTMAQVLSLSVALKRALGD